MMKIALIVCAVSLIASVQGVCQDVNVVQDFDVVGYTGRWFEIQRFLTRFEPEGSCVTADYFLTGDEAEPVGVFNREFNDGTEEYETIEGTARLANDLGDGKLLVTFAVAHGATVSCSVRPRKTTLQAFPAPYWVVDTDYTNFALVHSCVSVAGVSSKQAWILSRNTTLSPDSIARINAAIAENDIQGDRFVHTRQDSDCEYLPLQ